MDAFLKESSEPFFVYEDVVIREQPEVNDECTLWIEEGEQFVPDVSIKIHDNLPSGVYKWELDRSTWKASKVDINTDELYAFSNDCTSQILSEVEDFWNKKDIYKQYNITHKRGILLCGAPGCGKTSVIQMLVKQIVEKKGLVFMASCQTEFAGLAAMLNNTVKKIEKDRPIITIIEDVDQLITNMNGDALLLDFLDGSLSAENHLVILTSNDTTDLSEALLRPSRIDLIYEIPNPNATVRREYFKKKEVTPELITDLVKQTDGFSFAELKEVFIAVQVLGKSVMETVKRIKDPFKSKDYLHKSTKIQGI